MQSVARFFMALGVALGLAVAGVALSSYENPALAAKAKSSKATSSKPRAGTADRAATGRSAVEPQQCTVKEPCRIYNFY
jgi:hypothetical protein